MKNRLLFLLLLEAFLSCEKNNDLTESTNRLLVSNPFVNRYDKNFDKHDGACMGFSVQQFDPHLIDVSKFKKNQLGNLEKETGLIWQFISTSDSVINFNHLFSSEDDTNRVTYVAEKIDVKEPQNKILALGSDDGLKVWVNGDSVVCVHKGRQLLPYDDLVKIHLKKGENVILYKVDQGTGDWALFRKFVNAGKMVQIIEQNIPGMYSDMPEACIIPDTATGINLNLDDSRYLDEMHHATLSWKDFDSGKIINTIKMNTNEIPSFVTLPKGFTGDIVFEIQIRDKNKDILFKEKIPILTENMASCLINRLVNKEMDPIDPNLIMKKEAMIHFCHLNNDSTEYSTRLQAESIYDFYHALKNSENHEQVLQTLGYRSNLDNSIQPFRIYLPEDIEPVDSDPSLVFLFRWIVENDIENNFWTSQQVRSHWRTVKRAAHSTAYHSVLVMPFGRGYENYVGKATEEIPLILESLENRIAYDKERVGLFAHSNAPAMALDLLQIQCLPVRYVGFWSPILPEKKATIYGVLQRVKHRNPDLEWYVWQGAEDKKAKVTITRQWVEYMRSIGFKVTYFEEPHSTHFVYLGDPEKEFLKILNHMSEKRKRNEAI